MNKNDFFYNLPEKLIAQHPIEPRDTSRLLVYDRHNKAIEDKIFYNIINYIKAGDLLVLNNTKVIPARIYGIKEDTGAKIELLLHKRINYTDWEVLAKPAKRLTVGSRVIFPQGLSMIVLADGEDGLKSVRFAFDGVFEDILSQIGEMPLPPYIKEKLTDGQKYQTVYAKTEGSSAAPTAGLHFTPELLEKIKKNGVEIAEVLLHVGLGTFRPVKADDITNHKMHSEFYEIDQTNADRINAAIKDGRRVIAVGTTSVRVLESACGTDEFVKAQKGYTDIFIYPPYKFKIVNALITNFHLPESTLIMLVSALCGREQTLDIYNYAVSHEYRFFSFGDAMLII